MRPRAAVPDALAALPLVQGLDADGGLFTLGRDVPARVARALADESDLTKVGLISPIDYARHAGSYRIVPGIAVSTRVATGTARVRVRGDARSISTLAVDPRVTSETVLAAVLTAEKFSASTEAERRLPTIVPVASAVRTDFTSADAILEYHPWPDPPGHEDEFSLDLYEEWTDLTDLPWVSAIWVTREEDGEASWVKELSDARDRGVSIIDRIGHDAAIAHGLAPARTVDVLRSFEYTLGPDQEDSLREFFQYAFYLGILKDVPDLTFVDPSERED
jgi:predicted solute-binding protein